MFIYQLTRAFAYIKIRHPAKKVFDFMLPAVFSISLGALFFCFKKQINIWGNDGLVSAILSILQILPGFYIAALAAIISIGNNPILDKKIVGNPPPTILRLTEQYEEPTEVELTRRHFLCLLFSYLSIVSLLVCVTAVILQHLSPILSLIHSDFITDCLYLVSTVTFLFFIAQIIIVTLLGLYYIAEKMHT